MRIHHVLRKGLILLLVLAVLAGAGQVLLHPAGPMPIDLFPTPVAYHHDDIRARYQPLPERRTTTMDVLFATDRRPRPEADGLRYGHRPAHHLRLGAGRIRFGPPEWTWDHLVCVSLAEDREEAAPLILEGVEEYGPLCSTVPPAQAQAQPALRDSAGQDRFLRVVNERLDASRRKIITVYVHGSIVNFYHPLAISAGFQHYLQREGVMIAYAWRTRPGIWHYPGDVQRATESVPYLTALIEFLAENTAAEKINLISYSAGGPLLMSALVRIREAHPDWGAAELAAAYRIGSAVFAASDVDLASFSQDLLPRVYDVPREILVTLNRNDATLEFSEWFYAASRLGKPNINELSRNELEFLARAMQDKLLVLDAGEAIAARTGGRPQGHDYWYMNDWVSTDMLASLVWNLPPEQRGLARKEGRYAYHFPADYPRRIHRLILDAGGAE